MVAFSSKRFAVTGDMAFMMTTMGKWFPEAS
jgi:hypothetical protein